MKVVVLGCGRSGSRLASLLASQGHEVTVVDQDETAFRSLVEPFRGRLLLGSSQDEAILTAAFQDRPEVCIALEESDNLNIMVAQVAHKKYQVPRAIARIRDAELAEVYRGMGVEVLCSTDVVIAALLEMLKR